MRRERGDLLGRQRSLAGGLNRRLHAFHARAPGRGRVGERLQHRRERRRLLCPRRAETAFERFQSGGHGSRRGFQRLSVGRRQDHGTVEPHRSSRVDVGVKQLCVDAAAAEQDDRLALDQALQIAPVDAGDLSDLGRAAFRIFARPAALIACRLGDIGLAGGVLDPLPGAVGVLLAHRDRQVAVAEQRLGLFARAAPKCPRLPGTRARTSC